MTKWLDLAREDLGLKEVPGKGSNPKIVQFYEDSGHPEIKASDDPAWCAAFVGSCLKRAGYPNSGSLAARSYLKYGMPLDEPKEGCIVVLTRGDPKGWQGHVGFYTKGKLLGGNQGDQVSIASFKKKDVLGYRWPVEPTVAGLKEAGSSEIKVADAIKKVGEVALPPAAAIKVADETGVLDKMKEVTTDAGVVKDFVEALQAVFKLVAAHTAITTLALLVAGWLIASWWRQKRIERHRQGQPLSGQGG